jgi:hypothetical protein
MGIFQEVFGENFKKVKRLSKWAVGRKDGEEVEVGINRE